MINGIGLHPPAFNLVVHCSGSLITSRTCDPVAGQSLIGDTKDDNMAELACDGQIACFISYMCALLPDSFP